MPEHDITPPLPPLPPMVVTTEGIPNAEQIQPEVLPLSKRLWFGLGSLVCAAAIYGVNRVLPENPYDQMNAGGFLEAGLTATALVAINIALRGRIPKPSGN
jgi:hypothetical protein